MKRLIAIVCVLSACGGLAVDPALLMRTHTDPSRMRAQYGANSWHFATGFLRGGETAFTAIAWIRLHDTSTIASFGSQWSIEAARATREGGAVLPAIREVSVAGSNDGGTFADPHYACPELLADQWGYGCYAVNVRTGVPLTLVIAGTERQIPASNGVMQAFNVQGSAADYSWSLSSDWADDVEFGFAVNPLVEFFGQTGQIRWGGFYGSEREGAIEMAPITNEWMMCVAQARIVGGTVVDRMAAFTWGGENFPPGVSAHAASRASFAHDARVSFFTLHFAGVYFTKDVYGFKIFDRWLTDDELRNVRDLDMFEMQRRGMSRWRND